MFCGERLLNHTSIFTSWWGLGMRSGLPEIILDNCPEQNLMICSGHQFILVDAYSIEKVINYRTPSIFRRASAEVVQLRKWVWPSVDSAHPPHCVLQVCCCSLVWLRSYYTPGRGKIVLRK